MATYELWDTDTGNLIGSYESEAAAVAVVREAIQRYGRGYAESLVLAVEHDEETTALADGMALAARALAEPPMPGAGYVAGGG